MNHRLAQRFIALVCILALAACVGQALPTPTSTVMPPKPSKTPLPATTSTPQPTMMPTPIPLPTLALGERQNVDAGGYSLQIPKNFAVQIQKTQAAISNQDSTILISISVVPRRLKSQTVNTILAGFLGNVRQDVEDMKAEAPYPAKIGNNNGLAVNLTGTLHNAKNTGRVMIIDLGQQGFFYAFAFVEDGTNGKLWESEGSQVFDAILNSIQFFPPIISSTTGSCPLASDASYGYTKENSIKIGGDAFGGPARERAYLDNLVGSKGEKITYERSGSLDFGDTILDAFVITGLSEKVTLYIDEYSYTEPQAPVGFSCLAPFSLTKP